MADLVSLWLAQRLVGWLKQLGSLRLRGRRKAMAANLRGAGTLEFAPRARSRAPPVKGRCAGAHEAR
jgi:hypothetical protein